MTKLFGTVRDLETQAKELGQVGITPVTLEKSKARDVLKNFGQENPIEISKNQFLSFFCPYTIATRQETNLV